MIVNGAEAGDGAKPAVVKEAMLGESPRLS